MRAASIAEAISWTILLLGMLVKNVLGGTGLLVSIGGSLHGAVFLAFLFVLLVVGVNQRFGPVTWLLGALSSIPPFATLLFDWWAARSGRLDGHWRSEATGRAARLVRWTVTHPITLAATALSVFVVVLTGALR